MPEDQHDRGQQGAGRESGTAIPQAAPSVREAAAARAWPSGVLVVLVALFAGLDAVIFSIFVPGTDWAPLWVAGQLAWGDPVEAYDFALVSSRQEPLFGPVGDRPFVYPPSALMLFALLALAPFMVSYGLVVAGSLALLVHASRPLQARPVLLLLAPPVVLAAVAGQPTLLVAALILYGLTQLDRSEGRAGVIFGVAAMIKPPLLLLAPIALVAGGHWRAFVTVGVTAAAIGALSVAVFGIEAWLAWLSVLPQFNSLVTGFEPLLRNTVTPSAMAVRLDFPREVVMGCAALVAIPVAWFSFAQTRDLSIRLVALVGGALLISPYAMNYELAALAPAMAAAPIQTLRDRIVVVIWAASLFVTVSVAGLLAAYGWAVFRLAARWRMAASGRRIEAAS